jgi:hypothetical protein
MKAPVSTAWMQGCLAIFIFVLVGELSVLFNNYVFHRLGINRTVFLSALWILPLIAAFIASYFSERHKLLAGLSYTIMLPLLGSTAHFVSGELGATIDFAGLAGALVIFKIYLVMGAVTGAAGTALGLLLSRERGN